MRSSYQLLSRHTRRQARNHACRRAKVQPPSASSLIAHASSGCVCACGCGVGCAGLEVGWSKPVAGHFVWPCYRGGRIGVPSPLYRQHAVLPQLHGRWTVYEISDTKDILKARQLHQGEGGASSRPRTATTFAQQSSKRVVEEKATAIHSSLAEINRRSRRSKSTTSNLTGVTRRFTEQKRDPRGRCGTIQKTSGIESEDRGLITLVSAGGDLGTIFTAYREVLRRELPSAPVEFVAGACFCTGYPCFFT